MASQATLLTRRQVAALLDKSEDEVKARDGEALHPTKGPDGSWRYPPEEVSAVLRGVVVGSSEVEPAGAVCAAAFELFQSGKKLPDVVISLKQSPVLVRGLRVEYDVMAASFTIEPESVALLEKTFRTSVRDGAQLVSLVARMADQLRTEYQRGYESGRADAADLGEIVDADTGVKRLLSPSDLAAISRAAEQRWARTDCGTDPIDGRRAGDPTKRVD